MNVSTRGMVNIEFRTYGEDRGHYYPDSDRVVIYLNSHESLDDLYKTIQHESIHAAINRLSEELDEDHEERAIFFMAWAEDAL